MLLIVALHDWFLVRISCTSILSLVIYDTACTFSLHFSGPLLPPCLDDFWFGTKCKVGFEYRKHASWLPLQPSRLHHISGLKLEVFTSNSHSPHNVCYFAFLIAVQV